MIYNILFTSRSRKQLSKLPKDIQTKIVSYLEMKVKLHPTIYGKSLSGDKKGLLRYRVGDYRIISQLNSKESLILILDIGHRREIYS